MTVPEGTLAPIMVSERNCEAAFGLSPRQFRELVQASGLPFTAKGRSLRLVSARDFEAFLQRLATRPQSSGELDDDILSSLGLEER